MNILYDSRKTEYKEPFGPLTVGQSCCFRILIPAELRTESVVLEADGLRLNMQSAGFDGLYECFEGVLTPEAPGLFFYHFSVRDKNGAYRLFRRGTGTNIEEGELWQLSVLPADYAPPEAFRGAVYYQIFPDRFYQAAGVDFPDKLEPYTLKSFADFVPAAPDASDFAGGNLKGIAEKLDYLAGLHIRVIYLNPIFMALSNHRYDTADYMRIDPMLGTEADFRGLCDAAHKRGIKVILDGVFSHCGAISRYFDRDGRFGGGAASAGEQSPFYPWFRFEKFPEKYACWWNMDCLPETDEMQDGYLDMIIRGGDSVIAHWLEAGADGFRLDVADELPDEFIALLRQRVKELKPDAVVIGEVWEDASNKIAYGKRRQYFTGGELDGVINYPLRKAILDFVSGEDGGEGLAETVMTLAENYPAAALDCSMSVLGTHDTERLAQQIPDIPRRKLAAFLQFTLPGSPLIYYGDEAGLSGGRDPMNRLCFPWGHEDRSLTEFYRQLAEMKNKNAPLKTGSVEILEAGNGVFRFARHWDGQTIECLTDKYKKSFGFMRK